MSISRLPEWAHVVQPEVSGKIRSLPEDFVVEEVLGFVPSGQGEHLYLYLEKRELNTQEVAQFIARQLMIHPKNISYSGLKDRQAVTRQWFSVHTRRDVDPARLNSERVSVLDASRHRGKLKRGSHRLNRFEITVRELEGGFDLKAGLERLRTQGVPNYFGEQRFGRQGANVDRAREMFAGKLQPRRHQRGLYLSAARAFLFNEILSRRVAEGHWASGLPGEAMLLAGSNSFFCVEVLDDTLRARLSAFDIHPSAPLWGSGESPAAGEARELEAKVLAAWPGLVRGLENAGVRQLRRATRLVPEHLKAEPVDAKTVVFSFELVRGAFATSVLRELITIEPVPANQQLQTDDNP